MWEIAGILLFSITIFSNNVTAADYNDKIIAIVNDKVILKSEIQNAIDAPCANVE